MKPLSNTKFYEMLARKNEEYKNNVAIENQVVVHIDSVNKMKGCSEVTYIKGNRTHKALVKTIELASAIVDGQICVSNISALRGSDFSNIRYL